MHFFAKFYWVTFPTHSKPRYPMIILRGSAAFDVRTFNVHSYWVRKPSLFMYSIMWYSEPVFVNLLRSSGIDSQRGGPVRPPYLLYRPARLHRLAESNPRNWFFVSLNVYKYGLSLSRVNLLINIWIIWEVRSITDYRIWIWRISFKGFNSGHKKWSRLQNKTYIIIIKEFRIRTPTTPPPPTTTWDFSTLCSDFPRWRQKGGGGGEDRQLFH